MRKTCCASEPHQRSLGLPPFPNQRDIIYHLCALPELQDAKRETTRPYREHRRKVGERLCAVGTALDCFRYIGYADERYIRGADRGANVLALWMSQAASGYPTAEWLAYKQAREKDANVRKGEHGTAVFYANLIERTERGRNGIDTVRSIPFMRAYTVFNVAQCDGISSANVPAAPPFERIANAQAFFDAIGTDDIRHGSDGAYFSPASDTITLPNPGAFAAPEYYYATHAHERGHWTGAESRLNRTFGKRFGDRAYAFEELVAELTSAFVCAELSLPGQLRHVEYLGHWASILKDNPQALWTAGARASDAANYLANLARPESRSPSRSMHAACIVAPEGV